MHSDLEDEINKKCKTNLVYMNDSQDMYEMQICVRNEKFKKKYEKRIKNVYSKNKENIPDYDNFAEQYANLALNIDPYMVQILEKSTKDPVTKIIYEDLEKFFIEITSKAGKRNKKTAGKNKTSKNKTSKNKTSKRR